VDRPTRLRLGKNGRLVLAGIVFICALDFDHIPKYLFGIGATQSGRLAHTIPLFILFSAITTAFVYRWLFHRRLTYPVVTKIAETN